MTTAESKIINTMNHYQTDNNFSSYTCKITSRDIDPFSDSVLKKINPEIKATLSKKQMHAFISALKSSQRGKKHSIDIRGLIPLFFVRFYFVFLMGRDTRRYTICLEDDRRKRSQYVVGIYIGLVISIIFMFIAFALLYTFKSFLGIDFFTAHHLRDFF